MSNFTSSLDLIVTNQAQKEVTANALFDAGSTSTGYGRRASTSAGLTWGYYGAIMNIAGVPTNINAGTLTLTASQASIYIEASPINGAVTQNNTGWTAGRIPLYLLTTDSTSVTNWIDKRTWNKNSFDISSITVTGNFSLDYAQSNSQIIKLSGSPGATFTVTVPSRAWVFSVKNTSSQSATFTTGSGSTVTIAAGKNAQIMTDGSEVSRLSADV